MYNPSAISGNPTDPQEFEFVELKNTGPIALNLIGVSFSNGIEFQFTSGSAVTSDSTMRPVKRSSNSPMTTPGTPSPMDSDSRSSS
jgi:hypothetical protein